MVVGGATLVAASVIFMLSRGIAGIWDYGWSHTDLPLAVQLWPFYGMIAIAVVAGFRDKLVIACWAAIIPIALTNFSFAATGWTQFGYRYAMDFYPFLLLLVIRAIGNSIKWHHQ